MQGGDLWRFVVSRRSELTVDALQHVGAVVQCVAIATVLGVAIGIAVHRHPLASAATTAAASVVMTVPAFAMLAILLGMGTSPTIIALVLYALLPIVRQTIVGMTGVGRKTVDTARGIGMTRPQVLAKVMLPLSWPAILTGIRLSVQIDMVFLAIAAYAHGPGLGGLILTGLSRAGSVDAIPRVVVGTVLIALLATLLDGALVLLGRVTVSGGRNG